MRRGARTVKVEWGHSFQFRKTKKLWRWLVVMVTQKYESTQSHHTAHLKEVKLVKFMIWTFLHTYLFLWLCWVLVGSSIFVVVCGIFSFGAWDPVP